MKLYKFLIMTAILTLTISCAEEGRIDQVDTSSYIPEKATIISNTSIPGGAIIKYSIPDDKHLRGVKVVYKRNGKVCEASASRYVDSLKIEGFGDTGEHDAQLFSIGYNDRLSEPTGFTFRPETPVILTAQLSLSAVFGGVKVHLDGNEIGSDLAVILIQDSLLVDEGKKPSEMEWEDVYTFHTNLTDIDLVRRGMKPKTKLFGAYLRDRWSNCSDTVYCKLSPLEEYELPRTGVWKIVTLPGDETEVLNNSYSYYAHDHLFDGGWANKGAMGFNKGKRDRWITVDMTYVASFSRHRLMQRSNVTTVDTDWNPWHWQIWGSMDPNPDGSWDDSWYLLGDFTQYKPSGILPDGSGYGTFTPEDTEWIRNINEYEFQVTEQIPDPYRLCRYIRLRLLDNYTSAFTVYDEEPNNVGYMVGELILYGSQEETTE